MRSDDLPFKHPWQQGPIAEYADVIVGGTPSTEIPGFWGDEIPWMASGDVHRGHVFDVPGRISQRGLAASNATVVAPKAVAMALAGQGKTRGTVALTHVPICTNQSVALIKPRDARLDAEFLFQSLIPRYEEMRSRSAGGGRAGLTKAIIEKTPIQVPTRGEQRSIAEVLSTVDEIIEQTDALIAKTQQIKAGLMHDLFTRGVTPDGQLRPPRAEAPQLYKESPLGWIPKEWETDELRRWLSCISYGFTNPMPETEDGPYMVTAADVLDGRIQYDTCRRTSDLGFERLLTEKSRPKLGDVLLTKDGTLGRLAIVDRPRVCINQSVAVLRPKDIPDSRFLRALLGSPRWQQKMVLDAGGSTIRHIYITIVDKMIVPWPGSSDERMAMVERLEACETALDREHLNQRKLYALKRGLMHDLLTGRVRVSVAEPQKVAANEGAP